MARLDMWTITKRAIRPHALKRTVGLTILLMPLTVCLYAGLAKIVGLNATDQASLIFLAATPPIASAAGLCFILGFNARLALETTLIATILTPVLGPAIVALFLPDVVPISPFLLAQRLGLMIAGGFIVGITIRRIIGPERIDRNKLVFDGVAALGMVVFVIPLFDGVSATILSDPTRALYVLGLTILFNLGVNVAVFSVIRPKTNWKDAGAIGLIWGNRTIAIYLAALPHDAQFSLFVALYQFPMYVTPLVWKYLSSYFGFFSSSENTTPK